NVYVTEGEKDADRLASLGLCATTVASGNWDVDVQTLVGRDVIVLEDADKPGVKKATKAAQKLHGVTKTLRVVPLPRHEHTADDDGKDVSDWLDEDATRDVNELARVCFDKSLWTPPAQDATPSKAHILTVRADEVEQKQVEWIWENRLAFGKMTL